MKCFTWRRGEISEGIAVSDTDADVVILGDKGRYCKRVRLFPKNPAEVHDGLIHKAHPIKGAAELATEDFYVLAKPDNGEGERRTLIRILTEWTRTRSTMGVWEIASGSPKELVIGTGFRGCSRRVGSWRDGLVLMSPGDVIKVVPEGGYKTETFALFYDESGVQSVPFGDYIATKNIEIEKCLKL